MGFDKRSAGKKYTLEDGDTLDKIAERETAAGNPLTAAEIARFNWGTDDPDTVDEHLRDELGCYRRGDDKKFVISADADARSDLILPKRFKKQGLAVDRAVTISVQKKPEPPKQFEGCAQVQGVCFEFDKSFVRPSVVDDLKKVQAVLDKSPKAKVLIFGHTDKVGSEAYNQGLSERRARSVYAFITNQPKIWEELYKEENWGLRAVQSILKDMGGTLDPGPVDGVDGPKTKTAVRNFQGGNGLTVDGVAGPKTREKLFAAYMAGKHDVVIDDSRFMAPNHVGCGEFNPVLDTEDRHEPNRRVTFFFFHQDRLPRLPCKKGDLDPCKKQTKQPLPRHKDSFHCSFYDSVASKCPDEIGPIPVPVKQRTIRIESPVDDRRQYVNIGADAGHPEWGRKVRVKAKVLADGSPLAGVPVHWSFEEHSKLEWNSTDNGSFEASGLGDALRAGFDSEGLKKTVTSSTNGEGIAEVDFWTSQYGKDEYVVAAAFTEADSKRADLPAAQKSGKIVVWRRLWYQMTHDENLKDQADPSKPIPDPSTSETAYENVECEFDKTISRIYKKGDAGVPANTFYPEWMFQVGGGNADVAVIGTHNKVGFKAFLDPATSGGEKSGVTAHIIVCRYQFDCEDEFVGGAKRPKLTTKIDPVLNINPATRMSQEIPLTVAGVSAGSCIASPHPTGQLVHSGRCAYGVGANRVQFDLDDSSIVLEKARASLAAIKIKLPDAVRLPAVGETVRVSDLVLRGWDGPFLGESMGSHVLVVYPQDWENTITHEVGHSVNQTPRNANLVDHMKNHPNQFDNGQGNHCNYNVNVCVMFESGPIAGCIDEFCPVCKPYLRAQDMTKFVR